MNKIVASAAITIISLVMVMTFVFVKRSAALPLNFHKKDLPHHGLTIVRESDEEFASMKRRMNSRSTQEGIELPSVFIKNTNKKRVVAYTLKWEMTARDGRVATRVRRECREDILLGKKGQGDQTDRSLLPQSARLFSLSGYADGQAVSLSSETPMAIDNSNDQKLIDELNRRGALSRIQEQLKDTVSITVSIDAALFEDGVFVGQDTTGSLEAMKAQMNAKRDIVAQIFRRVRAGESYDSIMGSFEQRAASLSTSVMLPPNDAKVEEIYQHYEKRYLDEIIEMRRLGTADLAIRQFVWLNHDNKYLPLRKVSN